MAQEVSSRRSSGGTAALLRNAENARQDDQFDRMTKERGERGDNDNRPAQARTVPPTSAPQDHDERSPLLAENLASEFQERWEQSQRTFVDEPRQSVQEADELVADVIQQLAYQFSEERRSLEEQWGRGEDVSTEDLRLSLQRYRSFFNRLLKV
jgi:hypothetical protein